MVEVSVIVPAYNAGSSLAAALSSVRSQCLGDIEIIVIDDASQDQTHAIALSTAAADPRVRVIRRTTNGGPSAARNAGLDEAGGTWIALLDADDLYLPQRLSVLTDAARSSGCDLVADRILLRSPDGHHSLGAGIAPAPARSQGLLTAATFARNDRPFPGGFHQFGYLMPLMRRAFLDKKAIRYDPDIWLAEDFVLYMRCLLAGAKMIVLPDAYYQYNLLPDSTSREAANLPRNYEHLEIGNERILSLARASGDRAAYVQVRRRARNIAFLRAAHSYRHAVQSRLWREALACLVHMAFAPVECAHLLRLYLARRIDRVRRLHLAEPSDQKGRQPVC